MEIKEWLSTMAWDHSVHIVNYRHMLKQKHLTDDMKVLYDSFIATDEQFIIIYAEKLLQYLILIEHQETTI